MNKKLFYILTIIAFLLAVAYVANEYFRKAPSLEKEKPAYVLTQKKLLSEFESNESSANEKYLDKVIELQGVIDKIDVKEDRTIVNLESNNPLSGVTVEFQADQDLSGYSSGDPIHFKARLNGYLMGAQFNSGVLLK